MINLTKLIEVIRGSDLLDLNTNLFLTADTHYNHFNIIEYCNRPYRTILEMNKDLIDKYNSVVGKNDIVLHLGDFGFGSRKDLKPIREALNGYIILVKGNHDKRNSNQLWYDIGINEYILTDIETSDFIFSHKPIMNEHTDKINIHGHIHNSTLQSKYDPNKHINVSVEVTEYYPVNISLLLRGECKE